MSDAPKSDDAAKPPEQKPTAAKPAGSARKSASATAKIVREMDMMRAGFDAVVRGVTATQLILEGAPGLKLQDQIKVRLHHVVQRFDKEVRGLVRRTRGVSDQRQAITRITPKGMKLLETIQPELDQQTNTRFQKLSANDCHELSRLCALIFEDAACFTDKH